MFDKRILHIEDNFHNRRIVRKILEKQGYILHEAADGIIGFNMIKEFNPPVVLLDISLPGMDGIEIAQRVKADEQYKHIVLIAVTASAMQGDRERFLAAGCDDYLSKPFRSIDLIEIVNQHFEKIQKLEGLEKASPVEEEPLKASEPVESSVNLDSAAFQAFEEDTQKLEDTEKTETPEPELEGSPEKSELLKTASLQAVFSGQEPLPVEEEAEPSLEKDVSEETEQEEIPEPELTKTEEADETLRWPSFQSLKAKQGLETQEEEPPEPGYIASMDASDSLDTVSLHEDKAEIHTPEKVEFDQTAESMPVDESSLETGTLEETEPEEILEPEPILPMEASDSLDTVSLHEIKEEIQAPEKVKVDEVPEPVMDTLGEEDETLEPAWPALEEDDETLRPPPLWVKEAQELEMEEEETLEPEPVVPMGVNESLDTVFSHETPEQTKEFEEFEELEPEEIPEPIPMASMEGDNITTAPLTGLMEDSTFEEEEEVEEVEYIETIQASHDVEDATRPLAKPKRVRDLMEEIFSTKARASESEPQDEMTSRIIDMINADTIRPVDPNGDYDSA